MTRRDAITPTPLYVHNLILTNLNSELVTEIFIHHDANHILYIPLSQATHDDRLIWLLKEDGVYIVRLGYHIARSILGHNQDAVNFRSPKWGYSAES